MSRDYVIAIAVSVLAHGALAVSGYFDEPKRKVVENDEPKTQQVVLSLPPEEEPPILEDSAESLPPLEIASFTPPQLVDSPAVTLDAAFTQAYVPPPPSAPQLGIMKVPTGAAQSAGIAKSIAKIFELAALDQKPEIRFKADPIYPKELLQSRQDGEVLLGFVVDSQGNVRDPYIVSSTHVRFESAALQAIVRWKFKPGRKDGTAVNTRVELPISFSAGA